MREDSAIYTDDTKVYAAILSDAINPSHYKQGGIECIDAIKASMNLAEFIGYLQGNVLKYVWRHRHKGGLTERGTRYGTKC
jgi:hypothetical protein